VRTVRPSIILGKPVMGLIKRQPCPHCNGTGRVTKDGVEQPCDACGGTGKKAQ
jgi:DnaJ-class molecular chaperone